MSQFTGMDVAEVRQLATQLDHAAEEIKQLTQSLTSKLHGTAWVGQDQQTFLNDWQSQHQARLNQVSEALSQAAQIARRNADDQQQVSNS
jgi:uncharacterized protein YukE